MFGFLKKRVWISDVLPEMHGTAGGIQIVIRAFPCRLNPDTGERTYAYADFGVEFIEELSYRQLADFEQLRRSLASGVSKTVFIQLRDLSRFSVELKGPISSGHRPFYSDLADALIDAFQAKCIKP